MTDEVEVEVQQDPLADALAEYLGVSPENIKGFVIAVENEDAEDGMRLTSIWSTGTPWWRLLGFAKGLSSTLERMS